MEVRRSRPTVMPLLPALSFVVWVALLGAAGPALGAAFPACALFDGSCPADPVARDWDSCPAILDVVAPGGIVVVGDIHGQYDSLVALLVAGGIIAAAPGSPEEVEWTAGETVLVTPGDSISKGEKSLRVLALLRALEVAAVAVGGRVVATMGNHEAEFLADPCVGKARKFKAELCDSDIDPQLVAAGSDRLGLGEFLHCRPLAARVAMAERTWFFSHAGSTGGRSLDELRSEIEEGVGADSYKTDVLLGDAGLLEARLKPPWWETEDNPGGGEMRLRELAETLGAQHLVIGHQPGKYKFEDGTKRKKGEIFQKYGLIFLVDAGVIKGHSKGALLRLEPLEGGGVRATVVEFDGSTSTLWTAGR